MRITIIGSKGKMGQTFFHKFQEKGHNVNGIDLPFEHTELFQTVQNAELVLFCIPAKKMEEMCRLLDSHFPENCILMDVTSVKIMPIKSMERHYKGPVIGTHPLFGPRSPQYKKICLCLGSYFDQMTKEKEQLKKKAFNLFAEAGYEPFYATADEHDKAMAALQGLNFVTNVAYFAMTANIPELKNYLTPSFIRRMESAKVTVWEDGELFTGIFEANPYSHDIVRQYRSFLNVAAGGDMDVLVKLAQKWFTE